MADHYNMYPLRQLAGTWAACMELPLPDSYAPPIGWAADILRNRLGGPADRVVLYHADAVGLYIWQKYTSLFASVCANTSLALPLISTVESVTPVAHASMYTGLDPAGHGIRTYVRPQLTCSTLYDEMLMQGRRPVILAQEDSTFLHIFKGRDMEYHDAPNAEEIQEKALELIARDDYDLLSIHTFEYDNAAHHYGPESKEALNALALEARGFARIAEALRENKKDHRILLGYCPDHGQHLEPGGNGAHGSKLPEDMNVLHFYGTI